MRIKRSPNTVVQTEATGPITNPRGNVHWRSGDWQSVVFVRGRLRDCSVSEESQERMLVQAKPFRLACFNAVDRRRLHAEQFQTFVR